MSALPTRIIDLHTHLFNARCLPLAGIFATAMKADADQSALARGLAKLVNYLTEPYRDAERFSLAAPATPSGHAELLADLAVAELRRPSLNSVNPASVGLMSSPHIQPTELEKCIDQLELALNDLGEEQVAPPGLLSLESFGPMERVHRVVTRAIQKLQELADHGGEIDDYAAFIYNMLASEQHMTETLIARYGDKLPPMEFVHHMMDMQFAYGTTAEQLEMVAPKYAFYDTQLMRMNDLARHFPGTLIGFAAFDPRRENWETVVTRAIEMGFSGFKFYPAMGYLPYGNSDPEIEKRVQEFFRLCIARDIPVFTHCTPQGFETRAKRGLNADPRNWEKLLQANGGEFAKLRLCFGHAGGGRAEHQTETGTYHSAGWTAEQREWENRDNFAYTVARLCTTYPNVYCEFAYITELIESSVEEQAKAKARFAANLQYVIDASKNGTNEFSKKIAYGSDWNMPSMTKHPRAYLDVFLDLFTVNPALSPYTEDFFWKNAYRFLNR